MARRFLSDIQVNAASPLPNSVGLKKFTKTVYSVDKRKLCNSLYVQSIWLLTLKVDGAHKHRSPMKEKLKVS